MNSADSSPCDGAALCRLKDSGRVGRASLESLEQVLQEPWGRSCSPLCREQVRDLAVGRMQRSTFLAEVRLRWGGVALAAISDEYADGLPQRAMADAVRVRSYMIMEFGVSDTDARRDPSALCSDILRHLELSHEAAARMAGEWRTLRREQMLQLRLIKNMLTPLLPMRGLLEGDALVLRDTRAWLKLIPRLP
ncbi:hypothetical protein [Streptomyces gardneri]|uniref:hypothetical protein n=1 Tax=Streptomyces gardneri TaxID=66892 RepID=UPI001E3DC0C9|nr:hypothetical protein [Streptomyces gardneri]